MGPAYRHGPHRPSWPVSLLGERAWRQKAAPGQTGTRTPLAWGCGITTQPTLPSEELLRAFSWADIPLHPGGQSHSSRGAPHPSPVETGVGLLFEPSHCQEEENTAKPQRNRTSAGEEGDGGLVRKSSSKRGRKCSFSPRWLWEGGSQLSLMVLQVFTKDGLKS